MATIYEKFGAKVRKLRKEKKLSQEKFAELINRNPRTVVAIEAGKRNPTLKTIYKISLALKIPLSDLLKL